MWKYFRNRIAQMNIWDWGAMKVYAFTVGIVIGAYFPEFTKKYLLVFITLIAITFFWLLHSLFIRKSNK